MSSPSLTTPRFSLPSARSSIAPTNMTTPRSLRSFFDATPSDILDTPLSSLLLFPRPDYDALLDELSTLRKEVIEKDELVLQLQNAPQPANVDATIDAELQRAQVAALESKNALLEKEKNELVTAAGEAEAKGKAFKGEISKLRSHLQRSQQSFSEPPPELAQKMRELENDNKGLQDTVNTLRAENMKLIVEKNKQEGELSTQQKDLRHVQDMVSNAQILEKNYQTLQNQSKRLTEERNTLQTTVARLTEETQSLQQRLRTLESSNTAYKRANAEVQISLLSAEKENKTLIAKNHDLAEENTALEKQTHSLQKEKIATQTANDTLEEKAKRMEAEMKTLRDKTKAPVAPADEIRYRLDVERKCTKLAAENTQLIADLSDRIKAVDDLRCDNIKLSQTNERLDRDRQPLLRDLREYQRDVDELQEDKRELQAKLDRLAKVSSETQRELDNFKRKVASLTPRHDVSAPSSGDLDSSSRSSNSSDTLPQAIKRTSSEAFSKPTPPESSPASEKRLRVTTSSSSIRISSSRIYILETSNANVHNGELREGIIEALPSCKLESLRRVFKGDSVTNKWVVLFSAAPRDFTKTIYIGLRITATLTPPSCEGCPICHTGHDVWACPCLGLDGQELPSPKPLSGLPPFSHDGTPPRQGQNSLFSRISAPMPVEIADTADRTHQITSLQEDCRQDPRVVFCHFTGCMPTVDQLADIVCGGPVERFNLIDAKSIGFIHFVHPSHATDFLRYASRNLSRHRFENRREQGDREGTVSFMWSKTPFQVLEFEMASGIVQLGWTRSLELLDVPLRISAQQVATDCGTQKLYFWLREGQVVNGGRNIFVEFESIIDAVNAFNSVRALDYGNNVRWGRELCNRPVGLVRG